MAGSSFRNRWSWVLAAFVVGVGVGIGGMMMRRPPPLLPPRVEERNYVYVGSTRSLMSGSHVESNRKIGTVWELSSYQILMKPPGMTVRVYQFAHGEEKLLHTAQLLSLGYPNAFFTAFDLGHGSTEIEMWAPSVLSSAPVDMDLIGAKQWTVDLGKIESIYTDPFRTDIPSDVILSGELVALRFVIGRDHNESRFLPSMSIAARFHEVEEARLLESSKTNPGVEFVVVTVQKMDK